MFSGLSRVPTFTNRHPQPENKLLRFRFGKNAQVINSPSERLKPAGEKAAAGIGEGMSGAGAAVGNNARNAVSGFLNSATLRPVGVNIARYLTGEAKEGTIGFSQTDNRKTYNEGPMHQNTTSQGKERGYFTTTSFPLNAIPIRITAFTSALRISVSFLCR